MSERALDRATLLVTIIAGLAQPMSGLRWGDGLELVSVSSHLGVAHPPGYPLFTLLVHALTRLPLEPYSAALWLCKTAAVACSLGSWWLSKHLLCRVLEVPRPTSALAAGLMSIAFLFSASLWPTLLIVEVYSLNAALLVGIVALLSGGANGLSDRRLALAGVLQGLALAHHLSSLCTVPLLLWIGFRRGHRPGRIAAMAAAIVLPLLLYGSLLWRTQAGGDPGIYWSEPASVGALWQHVRGGDYASSLFLKADPFTAFTFQTWLSFALERASLFTSKLGNLFLGNGGLTATFGAFVLALAVIGATLCRRGGIATTAGVLVAVALQLSFVFTYNIVDIEDYFLGIHALLLPWVVVGLGFVWRLAAERASSPPRWRWLPLVPGLLLALTLITNKSTAYPNGRYAAEQWTQSALDQLPVGSSIITNESGDLFLLWYQQFARHQREDLAVYPGNMLESAWVRRSIMPEAARNHVGFSPQRRIRLDPYLEDLRSLVIEPLLQRGAVYTTLQHPRVLSALADSYDLVETATLLNEADHRRLLEEGHGRAPRVLRQIRPRSAGTSGR